MPGHAAHSHSASPLILHHQHPQEAVAAAVAQGTINSDAFAQWRDVMATAVAAEKATRVFPVSE